MFKDLKQGFQVSLLDKSGKVPHYHIGTIVGVSEPRIDQMKQPTFGQPMSYIKLHISEMLEFKPDKIILGCTHYPYLLKELVDFYPEKDFIDPARIFVEYIKKDLEKFNLLNLSDEIGNTEFYVSANPSSFVKNSQLFYKDIKTPIII